MINDTLVSVTSQGQITIPVKMRKRFGFKPNSTIVARASRNGIQLNAVTDFLDLIKTVKTNKLLKGKTADEIVKMEEKAVSEAVAEKYLRKEKRSGDKPVFA